MASFVTPFVSTCAGCLLKRVLLERLPFPREKRGVARGVLSSSAEVADATARYAIGRRK